ncbi:MGH1-like glycoside hydrolase domain-containing protein [Streptomyces tropicalis]|uniref:Mannosylglycerate hydrolase MGH1-like glycoside hydrolase domain-containing protein n=1 Tax=Streptomyces tropicalis TaxID=3034234 RepID=A0ABT5ZYD6_9ACTN|nr:hypothetical protein [Streptomyces tropicalis]MDF3297403.1 hypothetical protein [Streptomyces tropicalis]
MERTAHRTAHSAPACDPPRAHGALHAAAARVLADSWTGRSTVPSRGLYPHQWSWDSAFIAVGLRHLSPLRAQTELETLLAAQWADGRIPHIVFNPSVPLGAYFPSPDFWRSSTAGRAPGAPAAVETSGLVQPPVHALAAWLVHCADPRLSRARGFLARVHPRLAAWHRYLLHHRDLGGGGLAAVVHPWEQGMDNSPCWDVPLARVAPAPARSFRRADLDHGSPEDRPTDLDYGRYVRLAADYRDGGYRDGPGGGAGAFAVEDPAFNALLAASEHALARIARELGAAGTARHARAERLTAALVERLWDPARGIFLCRDLRAPAQAPERPVPGPAAGLRVSGPVTRGHASGPVTRGHASDPVDRGHASDPVAGGHPSGPVPERPVPGTGAGSHGSAPVPERQVPGPGTGPPGAGLVPELSVSGLVPLLLPGLPPGIVAALVRTLRGPHFALGGATRLVASYDLIGESFDPHRYWRGPAWFNTNWLVERGLRAHGERESADALREAVLHTAGATGFAEYADPYTGEARGAPGFGWTAALALDLLHDPCGQGVSAAGPGTFDTSEAAKDVKGGDRG